MVELLVKELNVNVNSRSISGQPPIFLASARGHYRIVSVTTESGANPHLAR